MDLLSAARWLSRPFVFGPRTRAEDLPVDAHGLIGDGFTAALVRVDGAIDWLCLPRFDSPSVFGALLDAERGGLTALTPARRPFSSLQRYDPDTNVLETLFQVEGQGVVRLTDFMPWTDDPRAAIHEVHRRVECVAGAVDLEALFDPRFGYAQGPFRLDVEEHGVHARAASGESLVAVLSGGSPWEPRPEGGMRARLHLRTGERRWMILSWNALRPEPISAYRPFEHLRATRHAWREWARRLRYDGPWRHHVLRSALLLKLLIYAPSGAMVAAPTTSLPEWVGGVRNWDYRYAWTRDAAMAIRATNLIGYSEEAREFFHFMRDALDRTPGLQVMYAVDGGPVPDERVLGHLRGVRGSAPVRVGNGARDQLQLDTAGALLDAADIYEHSGGSLSLRVWRHLRDVVDMVCQRWSEPDHGIWEPRSGLRHNVHSRLMCWVALNRGQRIARLFRDVAAHDRWRDAARLLRRDLVERGLSADGRHFVARYGSDTPDATLLLLPVAGLLSPTDPRAKRTLEWVRAELGDGPYLRRYRMDDGVGGEEGAFTLCGFWLAEALALENRLDEAQETFLAHAELANHVGLLAEEVHPRTREQLGNFPQAFSHLGLVNAAARIDLALRLRDEGLKQVPHPLRREG
jgi:GH15 family glucan-1,4-alpha-glucosidase